MRFEEAARIRDQLRAVERSLETQRVLLDDRADRDVVGIHREGPDLVIQVMSMRGGKLLDSRAFPFAGQEFPGDELLSSFLSLHYERAEPPEEVLVPIEPANAEALAEVLSDRRGRKVEIHVPRRGARADPLATANRNAEQSFRGWREDGVKRQDALAGLTRALGLAREPRWMECFDISTFQGAQAVGSGVSMRDGEPDRDGYRRYRVKGVAGQDDFAMLHEVITRRLRRGLAEGALPDLLVIDGGKGQLGAALAAARDLGVATRPDPGNPGLPFVQMVGLAKSRTLDAAALGATRVIARRSARSTRLADAAERAGKGFVAEAARTPERVFVPGRKDPVVLRQNSAELYLLVRLRDEAHRFAIEFHRRLRRARTLRSGLDEIAGVGEARRKALLRHFGSLRRVRDASLEDLQAVEGVGPAQARAIREFFHPPADARLIEGDGGRMDPVPRRNG
jgi:excinuclease ABC subunit C